MSEAKKEAKRLIERFLSNILLGTTFDEYLMKDTDYYMEQKEAKQCALICIDEMKKEVSWFKRLDYLEEVKTEIENA